MARIALLEDYSLLLALLKERIEREGEHQVVLTAGTGEALKQQWQEAEAEVLLLDLVVPDGDGVNIVKEIRKAFPRPFRTLVLSEQEATGVVTRVIRSGVNGFIDKLCSDEELIRAINCVCRGECYFSARIQAVFDKVRASGTALDKLLSPAELRFYPEMALGQLDQEIAQKYNLAESTIQCHRRNIMRKLDLHSRSELMALAMEQGVVCKHPAGPFIAPVW